MQIKWLKTAKSNLEEIVSYIAEQDYEHAIVVYATIRNEISKLSSFPELGRIGRVFGTRELVISSYPYIVPYRVKNNCVEILRIFHTSQQLPKNWN